jgi:TubC N-terminal docking domain
MNAHALLDELRALDVRLTAEGDLLGVNAPAGSLTEQMKAALVENKPRLLELLEWEWRELEAAGFKPKERCGKIIWQRPDNGFYYSKEVSLHLLNQKEHTGQERGNRKQVTQRGGDC